jgi:hypothetical protein
VEGAWRFNLTWQFWPGERVFLLVCWCRSNLPWLIPPRGVNLPGRANEGVAIGTIKLEQP